MKIAGHRFTLEEAVLCIAMAVFFAAILIGSRKFSAESALFPVMLSAPALILVALYAFQGALPAAVRRAISSSDRFAIGKKPEAVAGEDGKDEDAGVAKVYFVFAFTVAFAVLAWAVGFYLAAVAVIALYVVKTRAEIGRLGLVAAILAVLALGMIFLFDSAFGHHYGRGALLSFL